MNIPTNISNLTSTHYHKTNPIDTNDAVYISNITNQEDYLEYRTPQKIIETSKEGAIILRIQNEIIGCIFMDEYEQKLHGTIIYERGCLWIKEERRGHKLAIWLMQELSHIFQDKAIISVTSNPVVKHINKDILHYHAKEKSDLSDELIEILESFGPLHETYMYYMNDVMHKLNKQSL